MPLVHSDSVDAARVALADAPSPVVVVPVYNGYEDVTRCYESLLSQTRKDLAILVVDDCGPDRRPIELLDRIAERLDRLVVVLHRKENGGFTRACNDAFAATGRADVVLVNSDVVVGPEWAERLIDAANSSSLVATVSTLTNHGTILSVPYRNHPVSRLPQGMSTDDAAQRVAKNSLKLRPTIPTAVGHCTYIRRGVLDLLGGFDLAFGTGYGEEVDFSQRAVRAGFKNICADDVFVYHRGGASFTEEAREQQAANEKIINTRYPWYAPWVDRAMSDRHSPLALALDRARTALEPVAIGIDAMCIGSAWTGTQAVTLETILALSRLAPDNNLCVFHSFSMAKEIADLLDDLPNVWRAPVETLNEPHPQIVDIIYRPYQVNSLDALRWLRQQGRYVIVNQLDVIAWSNPTYFADFDEWLAYRELTRAVLASVDGVAFISAAARQEVISEGLPVDHLPNRVVHCGTNATYDVAHDTPVTAPSTMPDDGRPMLLLVGASYHHKNRAFAVKVLQGLRARGWDGRLVLAGPVPPHGHSMGDEALALLQDPSLRDHIVPLGELTEAEKRWLFQRASLSLYPTASEGFGLVPFESANLGVPVLTTRQGSLDEVLPPDIPTLDGYELGDAVDLAWRLLHDQDAAKQLCERISEHGQQFTWQTTAAGVLDLIHETLTQPRNRTAATWGEGWEPINLDVPQTMNSTRLANAVERRLQRLLGMQGLKRALVPEGSKRQDIARRSANSVRRAASR